MNHSSKIYFVLIVALLSSGSLVASDVDDKIDQIKTNSENSEKNLDQYKKNLAVVDKNIQEIDTALGTLQKQKKQLKNQVSQVDQK